MNIKLYIIISLLFTLVNANAQKVNTTSLIGKWSFAKFDMPGKMNLDIEGGKFVIGSELREEMNKNPEIKKIMADVLAKTLKELRNTVIEFKQGGKLNTIVNGKELSQSAEYFLDEKKQTITLKNRGTMMGNLDNAPITFEGDRIKIVQNVKKEGKSVNIIMILKK